MTWRGLLALTAAMTIIACGGSDTDPSNNNGGGSGGGSCSVPVGVLGCPKGLIQGTLDGQSVNYGVANGGATYTPIAPVPSLGIPAQDFIVFVGIASNNSQVVITARAKTGQAALGANVIDPETKNVSVNSAQLAFPATGGTAIGAGWLTSVAGGSGTITLNTVSTSSASGSFSLSMVATPGTPATGTRQLNGTFNVTF